VEAVVEKCGNLGGAQPDGGVTLAACSGCAGDYEDPERSASSADENDKPDEETGSACESRDTSQSAGDEGSFGSGKAIEADRWKEKQK
jgi:hypothetical protein